MARISPVEVRTALFIAGGAKWVFLSKRYGMRKGGLRCGSMLRFPSPFLNGGKLVPSWPSVRGGSRGPTG